ncbi:MAG: hypothetical protein DVB25_05475 [Verrucomicrobia bacterium]|nr:MAG: hypothetical protein DVB25_05475 [Verrucomicrobiota bacterium]
MVVTAKDERVKQVLIAAAVLGAITCGIVSLLLSWRLVPGLLGEWLGTLVGIISTPFFLEASFVIMGVLVVMVLNAVRSHREGDEFVALDELPERHAPPGGSAESPPSHN